MIKRSKCLPIVLKTCSSFKGHLENEEIFDVCLFPGMAKHCYTLFQCFFLYQFLAELFYAFCTVGESPIFKLTIAPWSVLCKMSTLGLEGVQFLEFPRTYKLLCTAKLWSVCTGVSEKQCHQLSCPGLECPKELSFLFITMFLRLQTFLLYCFGDFNHFKLNLNVSVKILWPATSYIFHGTSGILKNLGWHICLLGQHICYFQCNLFFIVRISPVVLKILKLQKFCLGRYKYIPLVKSDKFPYKHWYVHQQIYQLNIR